VKRQGKGPTKARAHLRDFQTRHFGVLTANVAWSQTARGVSRFCVLITGAARVAGYQNNDPGIVLGLTALFLRQLVRVGVDAIELRSLPCSGKTPKLSRPTTPSPATASALAESPSVSISMHGDALRVPALLASASLVTPVRLSNDEKFEDRRTDSILKTPTDCACYHPSS